MKIKKLRVILLLEADSNTLYKIIFNSRLMSVLEVSIEILQEITDGKGIKTATYLALSKKLIEDIANTKKLLIVTICIDITNYYNRVLHPFASLSTLYFRSDITCVLVLFRIIKPIKHIFMNYSEFRSSFILEVIASYFKE